MGTARKCTLTRSVSPSREDYGAGTHRNFQNGWPSVTSPSVQPNSPLAVADIPNEQVRLIPLPHSLIPLPGQCWPQTLIDFGNSSHRATTPCWTNTVKTSRRSSGAASGGSRTSTRTTRSRATASTTLRCSSSSRSHRARSADGVLWSGIASAMMAATVLLSWVPERAHGIPQEAISHSLSRTITTGETLNE